MIGFFRIITGKSRRTANYVFSEEIWIAEYGLKPKGKRAWRFGDRNRNTVVTVGGKKSPVSYAKAKTLATALLRQSGFPIYRTVYLLPLVKNRKAV
jgi:hypothetical protein